MHAFGRHWRRLDSAEVIETVASCDVLLAVIGLRWLDAVDAQGRRRLEQTDDWVRMELMTALRRDIPIIPVLVDRARMPRA